MRYATTVTLTAVLLAACAGQDGPREPEPDPTTRLEVDNRSTLDYTMYVIRDGGYRMRLGTATALTTTEFRLPDRVVRGLTSLRFQADPIGSSRQGFSDTISIQPGEVITLQIPPF